MKTNIFIPKKINVGYQNRSGTYTGKLAYVIYYDEKGKLRKEKSWNGWRDESIPNEEFENIPTSGFVLNKKAGGYSYGWEHRQTYCRVYDPRNFEFEITIENLLYILENANSIKGKGLEGEFVYGWDGKELVLMPVDSPDYKQISEYNQILHHSQNIKAKDLIVGAAYLTKNGEEKIYMGKFDYYGSGYKWMENGEYKISKNEEDIPIENSGYYNWNIPHETIDCLYGKYFWFAYKKYDYGWNSEGKQINKDTYKWAFDIVRSVSGKFITCKDDKCTEKYADIYELMTHTCDYSPRDEEKQKYIPYTFEKFKESLEIHKGRYYFSDTHYMYEIIGEGGTNLWIVKQYNSRYKLDCKEDEDFYNRFDFREKIITCGLHYGRIEKESIPMTIGELYKKLKPHYKEVYLKNGYLYRKENYYGNKE